MLKVDYLRERSVGWNSCRVLAGSTEVENTAELAVSCMRSLPRDQRIWKECPRQPALAESLARSGRCCAWEQVLILGWGDSAFMSMLLRELDRGPAALPRGSELTLFNSREGLLGSIRDRAQLEALSVLHVQGNPLDQDDLKAKLDISKCAAPPIALPADLPSLLPSALCLGDRYQLTVSAMTEHRQASLQAGTGLCFSCTEPQRGGGAGTSA